MNAYAIFGFSMPLSAEFADSYSNSQDFQTSGAGPSPRITAKMESEATPLGSG